MLTLISFSSLALAQPATATTRPVDGRLRTSHGVTIYPQLPTNQHQLRRGYFTRQPINTAFKITQQHRGLGGFYFHIIGNRFNGWVAARTVIPLIKHLTRQQFKTPVNRAAKLSIHTTTLPILTNRQLQLIMTHQLSTRQMNQLHLRVGKPIRTTRGQYIQILGPQGRHIRVSVNKMPLRFTLPTSHQSQHLITPTRTVMPFHAKAGNTLTTSKSGTTTTGQPQNLNNTVKFRHAENNPALAHPNSPAGHPQHVNAPTPVTPPNQKSTSTPQGNHSMGTPVKPLAKLNDHQTVQGPAITQPHATIRLHPSTATAQTHQVPVSSVATPANTASIATTTQTATTAETALRYQQIHTNQVATAARLANQPSTSVSPASQVPIRNSASVQVSQATSAQTDHKTVTSAAIPQAVAVTSSTPTATGTSVVSQVRTVPHKLPVTPQRQRPHQRQSQPGHQVQRL